MNFKLYFSKILFSLYTEIKYEISRFYLKNFFYFFYLKIFLLFGVFSLFSLFLIFIEFSELFPQYNLISGTFSMLFGEGGVVPFRSVYIVVPENVGDQINVICLCIKIAAVGAT